jgi:DUF971 family protein
MDPQTTPVRMHLKKDEKLEIDWKDGRKCVYTLSLLRTMCPCAECRTTRTAKSRLTILPGNYSGKLSAVAAEMVGNYAIRIDWSDKHGSGIYSFEYLREIAGPPISPA